MPGACQMCIQQGVQQGYGTGGVPSRVPTRPTVADRGQTVDCRCLVDVLPV